MLAENIVLDLLSNGLEQKEVAPLVFKSVRWVELHLEKLRDENNCKTTLALMFLFGKAKEAANDSLISKAAILKKKKVK